MAVARGGVVLTMMAAKFSWDDFAISLIDLGLWSKASSSV